MQWFWNVNGLSSVKVTLIWQYHSNVTRQAGFASCCVICVCAGISRYSLLTRSYVNSFCAIWLTHNPQHCAPRPLNVRSVVFCGCSSVMVIFWNDFPRISPRAPWRCATWVSSWQMWVPGWIEWHGGSKVSTLPVNPNSLSIRFQSYKWP